MKRAFRSRTASPTPAGFRPQFRAALALKDGRRVEAEFLDHPADREVDADLFYHECPARTEPHCPRPKPGERTGFPLLSGNK